MAKRATKRGYRAGELVLPTGIDRLAVARFAAHAVECPLDAILDDQARIRPFAEIPAEAKLLITRVDYHPDGTIRSLRIVDRLGAARLLAALSDDPATAASDAPTFAERLEAEAADVISARDALRRSLAHGRQTPQN